MMKFKLALATALTTDIAAAQAPGLIKIGRRIKNTGQVSPQLLREFRN